MTRRFDIYNRWGTIDLMYALGNQTPRARQPGRIRTRFDDRARDRDGARDRGATLSLDDVHRWHRAGDARARERDWDEREDAWADDDAWARRRWRRARAQWVARTASDGGDAERFR